MSFESLSLPLSIPCPNCQRKLKIERREVLGRKVKCPKCQFPFIVRPPSGEKEDEVEMELVTDEPLVGTRARWIPDEEINSSPIVEAAKSNAPPETPAPIQPAPAVSSPGPIIVSAEDQPVITRLRKRRTRSKASAWIFGSCLIAAIAIIVVVVVNQPVTESQTSLPSDSAANDHVDATDPLQPYSKSQLQSHVDLVEEFQPTDGGPIELYMFPSGVNLVIHFRPALLWSNQREYQILKASLTDRLTGSPQAPGWIEESLLKLCRRKPEQIEELTIGCIIGAQGTEPDVCVVVRLKEAEKLSDLIDEFNGTYLYDITERPNLRLKVDDEFGYLIKDEKTFAIVPEHLAGELEFSIEAPNRDISEGMDQLLRETDREKLLTVVGNFGDIQRNSEVLFPTESREALSLLFEWFGEEIETISWSVHPEPYLHSEINLRINNISSPSKVNDRLQAQLVNLPQTMWKDVCEKMSPQEAGFRKLIGRLPAMLEAFQQSTVASTTSRYLKLTTVLPQQAAPNLALATMLTVDEASRTDFTKQVVASSSGPKLPETVAERLKLSVDTEFSRRPLEQALQYLCNEIKVNLEVDGEALEEAGYTRNMPQTFVLGTVPAEQGFAKIITSSQDVGKELVISLDEESKTIRFTTLKFAKIRGWEVHSLEHLY